MKKGQTANNWVIAPRSWTKYSSEFIGHKISNTRWEIKVIKENLHKGERVK